MEIKIVKCLTDNYSYIIFNKENLLCAVVDPSEAGPIIEEVEPESKFIKIRRIFFLSITCVDELTTQIAGEVSIEGYSDSDEWISITEPAIVEKYGLQFLQELSKFFKNTSYNHL